jgi:hypothetical protein
MVEPKKAASFTVEFAPIGAGVFAHEMALRVKSNPFEQHRLALTGECIQVGSPAVPIKPVAYLPWNAIVPCASRYFSPTARHVPPALTMLASFWAMPTAQEDITIDGLPGGSLDELQLGDIRIGRTAVEVFHLTNRSDGKAFRCAAP